MTTREEFRGLVDALTDAAGGYECMYVEKHERDAAQNAVVAAWDAQAAEVERLRAEVESLRVGVPLTAENAPRARVVALADGDVLVADGEGWWQWTRDACHDKTEYLLRVGATVLAWRKP